MKRTQARIIFFIALFALLSVKGSFAADAEKIGHVDLRTALNESDSGKKAMADLDSIVKTKQAALDEKAKSIEKLKGELEKQASVLSPEAKRTKEEEIERIMRDFQRFAQDSQAEVQKKQNEITTVIVKELREITEKIGREEGYSMVLENVGGLILYSKKELDITDKVVKRYNESKTKPKK